MSAPTVDEILSDTAIGNGYHCWAVEGGSITVTASQLRPALEAACDSTMPDWTALVSYDEEDGFFVA